MKKVSHSGNMIVEFVLAVGVLAAFLVGFIHLGQAALTRLRLIQWARLGSDLQSCGLHSEETVRAILTQSMRPVSGGANVEIEMGPWRKTSASRFYRLVGARVSVYDDKLKLNLSEESVVQKTVGGGS